MTRTMLALSMVLLAACTHAAKPAQVDNRAQGSAAPVDAGEADEVTAFVERWETCMHWSGEEPYDAARREEIGRAIEASCPGNDETRARLEAKYADQPDVMARLRALEE